MLTDEIKEQLLVARPEAVAPLQGEAASLRRIQVLIQRKPLPQETV